MVMDASENVAVSCSAQHALHIGAAHGARPSGALRNRTCAVEPSIKGTSAHCAVLLLPAACQDVVDRLATAHTRKDL